jgi:hypothetical protein
MSGPIADDRVPVSVAKVRKYYDERGQARGDSRSGRSGAARGTRVAGRSSNSDNAFTASATRPEIEPIACVVRFDQVPIR